jgi:zinc protease
VRSVRGSSAYLETPSAGDYEAVSLAQMGEVHRLIFGDVSGMHFVFTGNVDAAQLRPLVARYIASLPGAPSAVNEADRSRSSTGLAIQAAALPSERTGIRVERQTNPAQRAFLRVRYVNPAVARTPENMVMALHMRRAIAERIRVQLRANLGLVYSPTVSIDFRDSQATGLTANMQATVDPDNVPLVERELQATVRGLIAQPISSEELAALLAAEQDWQSQFGRSSATTSALLTEISLNQITAQQFVAAREQARQLTATQLQQAFAQIFNDVSPSVGIYRPHPSKLVGTSSLSELRMGSPQ